MAGDYLVISDTQIPFEHPKALSFFIYMKRHFKIPDDHVLHVGDELDNYHGGRWPKDPNGHFSATGELAAAKSKLKEWYAAFPKMKLAISNHGLRWVRKATAAEIPSEMLRSYREIIEAPDGWVWKPEWRFNTRKPFRMIHGLGYSGINAQRNAAMDSGISTVHGHLVHAAIDFIKTDVLDIWGMCVAAAIDREAYAFEYGKESRFKPCLTGGVVSMDGRMPMLVPME